MANNYLLKCLLCDYEFVETSDMVNIHCPNCDLKKNRFGFCAIVDKNVSFVEELIVNMTNLGFAKTTSFES